jgi:hypothetical protein
MIHSPGTNSSRRIGHRAALACLILFLCQCRDRPASTVSGSIIADLERLACSTPPTAEQVRPYDEGLVFQSYRVKKVLQGSLPAETIQIAHWAVIDGESQEIDDDLGESVQLELLPFSKVPGVDDLFQANDLDDFTAPQFIEVQPPGQPVASGFRYQYGGPISKQMRLFWELKDQLRLIAIGNSRTGVGVATEAFFQPQNGLTPVALNLAPPGSDLELQNLLVENYVLPLPKLEWVIWGICPRYFNRHRRDNDRLRPFLESHGYRYDRENASEIWLPSAQQEVTLAEVRAICPPGTDCYGATLREDGESPNPELPGDAETLKNAFSIVRFAWDQDMWQAFEQQVKALQARGTKVLLFIPPTHPFCINTQASDPDSSGPEHHAQVVDKLKKLTTDLDNVWFEDFHRAGHHDFTPEDFSDVGHLDQSGAQKLTLRLAQQIHATP